MYMVDDPSGRGIATIRCEINSKATDCVLDTGAAVCCMSEIMTDRLGVKPDNEVILEWLFTISCIACASRDSNPGCKLGKLESYPWTTSALALVGCIP